MSMVHGNDGYSNIFGAPKPAPGGAIGGAIDSFVSSPAFPLVAAAIVGGAAGQAFGAGSAATTAVKAAPTVIGAATAAKVTLPMNNAGLKMADTNPINFTGSGDTQLTGTTASSGTAQLPGQPIIINTGTASTQAQQAALPGNNSLLYIGLGALLFFLVRRLK